VTRDEFNVAINGDTVLGLVADRTKYKALRQMAGTFRRPDVAAVIADVIQALDVAILAAEQLGITPQELS
jgi:hypothetical protein